MRLQKWFMAALLLIGQAIAFSQAVGEWRVNLLRGSATQQTVTGATQEQAWASCQALIPATAAAEQSWTCQTPRYVRTVRPAPLPPVNCVVSGPVIALGDPSACVNGQRTRIRTSTLTVVTPAANGGTACPSPLVTSSTVTEACTVEPPPPDSPPSGSVVDGASYTITGSGFGTHALNIKWLGGKGGVIESTTTGATPSNSNGWVFNQGLGRNATIATSQARSGTKSLYFNLDSDAGAYNGAVRLDSGAGIAPSSDLFVSWWVRRVHTGSGQWKMFRINYQNDITDDAPQLVMFNWDDQEQFFVRTSAPGTGPTNWDAPYPKGDARWYRMDLAVRTSSVGGSDGRYVMTLFEPGRPPQTVTVTGGTYTSTAKLWRWFLWQNYIGNGVETQQTWLDDLYVQVGTAARVELCDQPTWSACTFREIQQPTAWADGAITIKVNKGGFTSGAQPYLYVVKADGSAIAAGRITLQ